MAKDQTDRINISSEDIESENLNKLKSIFPQFVKDGQVDFDSLQEFFNKEGISSGTEKYGLSWNGKSNAFKAIRLPSTGTLNPQREESKDWNNTENIFIEGDNLEVLKLLQKHYREKIKMIYIDPPYNTGKDFVYKDNFTQSVADYYEQTGQTKDGIKMIANTEKNGRYHSDWLTMMYPRLFLAKNLLKDDGVIFVSIDDNEVANLRLIMDEIFGEENFIGEFSVENNPKGRKNGKFISITNDYCLIYTKNINLSYFEKIIPKHAIDMAEDENGDFIRKSGKRVLMGENTLNKLVSNFKSPKHYSAYIKDNDLVLKQEKTLDDIDKELIKKGYNRYTTFNNNKFVENTYTKEKFQDLFDEESLDIREDKIYEKHFSDLMQIKSILSNNEYEAIVNNKKILYKIDLKTTSAKQDLVELLGGDYFSFPKNISFIKHLVSLSTTKDDIILDFFAGSGTTAHAVMDLNSEDEGNRKWICVQLPEETDKDSEAYKAGYKTISQIARERIRRAGEFLKDNKANLPLKVDLGFKAYTLSKSNYRIWNELSADSDAKEIIEQSKLFIDKPLVDKYNEESVVNEILLKEGFDLNSKTEKGNGILKEYIVNSGEKNIFITFAKKVSKEEVEKLGIKESDTFVCFDSALDDTTKVNIGRSINLRVI